MADIKLPFPNVRTIILEKAADAIKAAAEHIKQFERTEDGGTCNLDGVVINRGFTSKEIAKISQLSGVHIGDKLDSRWWKGCRFIDFDYKGKANCRSRMADAAYQLLREKGIDVMMFHQMD